MKVRAVSFDCAETLMSVNWAPGEFAARCLSELGIQPPAEGQAIYDRMFSARGKEYYAASRSGQVDSFWRVLTRDWLDRMALGASVEDLMAAGDRLLYGEPSQVYRVFDDVVPTLARLEAMDIPLVVVSNWDASLETVLDRFGLRNWFSHVFASLAIGWEKPDPRIFHAACNSLGLLPRDVLHVGDNPLDDVQGAREAGLQALLIDRSGRAPGSIQSLTETVDWIQRQAK